SRDQRAGFEPGLRLATRRGLLGGRCPPPGPSGPVTRGPTLSPARNAELFAPHSALRVPRWSAILHQVRQLANLCFVERLQGASAWLRNSLTQCKKRVSILLERIRGWCSERRGFPPPGQARRLA